MVTYTKNNITIEYLDDKNKVVATNIQKGSASGTVQFWNTKSNTVAKLIKAGYEVDYTKSNLPLKNNDNIKLPDKLTNRIIYQVYLKHRMVKITANKVNPFTGKKDPNLVRKIRQIVRYHGTKQSIKNNVQVVKFTRTGLVDMVTGNVKYANWNRAKYTFNDVTSPIIKGYVPDIKLVKGNTVTAKSNDFIHYVTYMKQIKDNSMLKHSESKIVVKPASTVKQTTSKVVESGTEYVKSHKLLVAGLAGVAVLILGGLDIYKNNK